MSPSPSNDAGPSQGVREAGGEFADDLANLDETLVQSGSAPEAADARLKRAGQCLELLERVWPRGGDATLPVVERALDELVESPAYEADGKRLGRFVIRRELGRGGHGVVFLAFDPVLRREVALKVPRPGVLVTPDLRRRFLREAQAAAVLDHPNIVRIYEAGEIGPACYLTAAFCDGPNLADWLVQNDGTMPPRAAAVLAVQLADALEHAHERQILHRDFKPSNVLLDPRRKGGAKHDLPFVPKLTDFGLAKVVEESAANETRSGTILGTPQYMAPEQATGRTAEVGVATDVYALGATLYETLVGQPPLQGANDAETLHLIRTEEPTPPRRQRAEIPLDLEAICLKCLEKDPRHRYGSARALAGDLQRFLDGKPTLARPLRGYDRALRWAKREPMGAAFVVTCVLAVALLTGSWIWYTVQIQHAVELSSVLGRGLIERERASNRELAAANLRIVMNDWNDGRGGEARRRWRDWTERGREQASLGTLVEWVGTLLDRRAGEQTATPIAGPAPFTAVSISGDGECGVAATPWGGLLRFVPHAGTVQWRVDDLGLGSDAQLTWSPTWDGVAAWSSLGVVAILDRHGAVQWKSPRLAEPIVGVALANPERTDGVRAAVLSADGAVHALDGANELRSWYRTPFAAVALHFADDSPVAFGADGRAAVNDVALPAATDAAAKFRRFATSRTGRFAAAVGERGAARLWSLDEAAVVELDSAPTVETYCYATFSDDGLALYAVRESGVVDVWQTTTGRWLFKFSAVRGAVRELRFPAPGKRPMVLLDADPRGKQA